MFGWLDTSEVIAFAKSIAQDINTVFPPGQPPKPTKREQEKVARDLENTLQKIAVFHQEKRLNFLKKSKLLNTLKWELNELGYQQDFIQDVVKDALVRMI